MGKDHMELYETRFIEQQANQEQLKKLAKKRLKRTWINSELKSKFFRLWIIRMSSNYTNILRMRQPSIWSWKNAQEENFLIEFLKKSTFQRKMQQEFLNRFCRRSIIVIIQGYVIEISNQKTSFLNLKMNYQM